jgi:hypothetical protein
MSLFRDNFAATSSASSIDFEDNTGLLQHLQRFTPSC